MVPQRLSHILVTRDCPQLVLWQPNSRSEFAQYPVMRIGVVQNLVAVDVDIVRYWALAHDRWKLRRLLF